MNKKRIFGIILFILIGFFMFTFANPNEKVEDEKGKTNVEEKFNKDKKNKKEDVKEEEVKPVAIIEPTKTVNVEVSNVKPTENNIPNIQPVDNTKEIEKALELEKAKTKAIEELENYKKEYDYTDSIDRKEIVDEYSDAIKDAKDVTDVDRLLNEGEKAIDELVKIDLTKYIDDAINAIKEYATEDEKYISEITDEKDKSIGKLEELKETDLGDLNLENIKNEIDVIVEVTNDNIDEIILNKTFEVTFVGKNNVQVKQVVKYKNSATVPTEDAFVNPVYKNVTYELTGFDKDFSEVKENLTINAEYKIKKIVANLYLNEDVMPNPKDKNAKKYSKLGSYELKTDNEKLNASIIADTNKTVYTNDEIDIKTLFAENVQLPVLEGKYDYYEYYVVKFVAEGSQPSVHIDAIKMHDSKKELEDAKDRLNDLINSLPENCTETYTTNTCNALNAEVVKAKELADNATLEDIENAISNITDAKDNLVELALNDIIISLDKDTYYLNGDSAIVKVKAIYNDKNKNDAITNYTTITAFDNTSVGSKEVKVSYTFNGVTKEGTANYTVIRTDEQLANLFKDTSATLHSNWYWVPFSTSKPYIDFKNLPEGANVVSVRRYDKSNVSLTKTNRTTFDFNNNSEYRDIRHNGDKAIYITYIIDDQIYTKVYDETFGEIE